MSSLEAVLSNIPVLPWMDPTQSVCVAAPVVAVRSPVHLCSLALCYNIDNIEFRGLTNFQNKYELTGPRCNHWFPEETISIMFQSCLPARVTSAVS